MMLAMAYVLVLAIVALEIPLALSLKQRINEEVKLQARNGADVVSVISRQAIAANAESALQKLVSEPAAQARGRIVVVDDNGKILADSAGTASLGSTILSRPEIRDALNGQTVQFTRESDTLNRTLLATAVPVTEGEDTVGAVRVTQDVAAEVAAFRRAVIGLILVGIAVLGVGLIAGAVIARQIARPLRRAEAAARAVADGDLDARAPVEGSSEQQSLALTFNEMTDRLSGSLKAQSQFVADASHQLRTPLTGLRLRLEEARARSSDASVNHEIDRGIDEVDRLARTVEELLVLSQTGERDARTDSIELGALVRGAADRWRPIAESSGHTIEVATDDAETISASRADLDRVIDALIENALKYSPSGTAVEVAVDGGSISVRDHGPGIGDESSAELFERFHRGNAGAASSESTGLGLAIARELAQRWRADVTLENADDGGAVARITFAPVVNPERIS